MSELFAFEPNYAPSSGTNAGGLQPSTTVTATNASSTASQEFSGALDSNGQRNIQVANKTTAWAHVNFGKFGLVAAATVANSYPVAPGAVVIVTVNSEVSGATVILDAAPGTATAVIFTRGVGQ